MEWLDKARRQPQGTKMKLALGGAALLTLIIVGTWFVAIKKTKTPDTAVANSKSDDLKPLFLIFKNAKDSWHSIRQDAKAAKAPDVIQ